MFDDVSKEYFHRDPIKAFAHAWDLIVSESEV